MSQSALPIKVCNEVSKHFYCPVCSHIFDDPVISVSCGHTYCRRCIYAQTAEDGTAKCPVDQATCELATLVSNRAITGQLEDLLIHCRHGLVWAETSQQYEPDPGGCQQQIHLGQRHQHEDNCSYQFVSCPHGNEHCGIFRQKDLAPHLTQCSRMPCPHQVRGCAYSGNSAAVQAHAAACDHRHSAVSDAQHSPENMTSLRAENAALRESVRLLTDRVAHLERNKTTQTAQLAQCVGLLHLLQQRHDDLSRRVDKLSLRRAPSAVEPQRPRSGLSEARRSTSSLAGCAGTSRSGENWKMPNDMFKCIGTLRGHPGAVWAICTHGNTIISAGAADIKVWNLEQLSKGCQRTVRGHTAQVQSLTIADGLLYSAGADKSIRCWDIANDYSQVKVVEKAHDDVIACVIHDDTHLYSCSFSTIGVRQLVTLTPVHTITGLHHWVRHLVLDQGLLYSGSHNTIQIWNTEKKYEMAGKIDHNFGSVHSLAITAKFIIAGTYNQNIHLFDASSHQHTRKLSGHLGTVTCLLTSPSGRYLFSCSTDNKTLIWSLETFLTVQPPLNRHQGAVTSSWLHGDFLLTGSEDTEVKIFKYFRAIT